jgi:hypothetical protein
MRGASLRDGKMEKGANMEKPTPDSYIPLTTEDL